MDKLTVLERAWIEEMLQYAMDQGGPWRTVKFTTAQRETLRLKLCLGELESGELEDHDEDES